MVTFTSNKNFKSIYILFLTFKINNKANIVYYLNKISPDLIIRWILIILYLNFFVENISIPKLVKS